MTNPSLLQMINNPSCLEDYDPNAMSVEKARQFIKQFLEPLQATETCKLTQGLGRILAHDIISPANVPNYDNSAMDGFALHADDLNQAPLKIIGTALAGQPFTGQVNRGECVRIMTGAMMPHGTDTVVMQEKVLRENDSIRLIELPHARANVRYAGEDLQLGQTVLARGHRIRPADLGLLASLGIAEMPVYCPLKVAIFSTGDELVPIGTTLASGQVYDSNRYSLLGMLARLGVDIIDMGTIKDDPSLLESTLLKAANTADAIITSGGVSVGEADYMRQLLTKHGQVVFWKISMKPGRPLAYGKLGKAHFFGLPGNPVAVMVTFYQFVREALLHLMGQNIIKPLPMFEVECVSPIKKLTGRTEFQRGILFTDEQGRWKVKTTGGQGSAILSSMSIADCFIVLDEATGNLEPGSKVSIQVMDGIV